MVKGGMVDLIGRLKVFNDSPVSSVITYGKIGYYRQGYTDAEEVRVHFASPSTAYIQLEPSYDGRAVELGASVFQGCIDSMSVDLLANLSARWYNITVSGKYDISYIEFRGHRAGRR
jgi:hypothetical protein